MRSASVTVDKVVGERWWRCPVCNAVKLHARDLTVDCLCREIEQSQSAAEANSKHLNVRTSSPALLQIHGMTTLTVTKTRGAASNTCLRLIAVNINQRQECNAVTDEQELESSHILFVLQPWL